MGILRQIDGPVIRRTLSRIKPKVLERLEITVRAVREFIEQNGEYATYVRCVGVRKPSAEENPPEYGIALYLVSTNKLPINLMRRINKVAKGNRVYQCGSREDFHFGGGS